MMWSCERTLRETTEALDPHLLIIWRSCFVMQKVSDDATSALKHFRCDASDRLKQPPSKRKVSDATQWIHAEIRFDSLREDDTEGAEHRGCCIRDAQCDSESHRQEMGQVENNDRYLRQMGEFQTMSDELTDAKEQLHLASPAERDDPDERLQTWCTQTTGSDTTAATDRVSAAKTTCATTVLIATIETAITQRSTTTTISPRTQTTDETRCTKTRTST